MTIVGIVCINPNVAMSILLEVCSCNLLLNTLNSIQQATCSQNINQ